LQGGRAGATARLKEEATETATWRSHASPKMANNGWISKINKCKCPLPVSNDKNKQGMLKAEQ
jgi:hypothetical protein